MSTTKHPVNRPVDLYPYKVLAKDTMKEWHWIYETCPKTSSLLVRTSRMGSNALYGFKYQEDAIAFKLKFGTIP